MRVQIRATSLYPTVFVFASFFNNDKYACNSAKLWLDFDSQQLPVYRIQKKKKEISQLAIDLCTIVFYVDGVSSSNFLLIFKLAMNGKNVR